MARGEMLPNPMSDQFAENFQNIASKNPKLWEDLRADATVTRTDCASMVGIAVALIEGMMATARVLWAMDLNSPEVQEALKDLAENLELTLIRTRADEMPGARIVPTGEPDAHPK